jgi:hypothetical protein
MKKIIASVLSASIAISILNVIARPALANSWAGDERSGECYIPNRQTSFTCQFGSYGKGREARQIGGFYINPTHQFGGSGSIPIQYRINGGGWRDAQVTLNQTSGNYIDFGDGVDNFDFRFVRPTQDSLGGGSTIKFKFNYDLDR